jgi:hypothetical protein
LHEVVTVTVSAPPRPLSQEDLQDLAGLEALIEEARKRAARRRRRGAGAILVVVASVALFIGLWAGGSGTGGGTASSNAPSPTGTAAARGIVVVTIRGYVRVVRTLRSSSGPIGYREAGRFRIVWRLPASGLKRGHTFRSTAAVITGTTAAIDVGAPARSCHGRLSAGRKPVLLRIVSPRRNGTNNVGMIASPNPIETATSASCARGLRATRWTGSPTGAWIDVTPPRRDPTTDWSSFNHVGVGFYPNFTPLPKGGNSEGWIHGDIPGGYLTWLAVAQMHKVTHPAQKRR